MEPGNAIGKSIFTSMPAKTVTAAPPPKCEEFAFARSNDLVSAAWGGYFCSCRRSSDLRDYRFGKEGPDGLHITERLFLVRRGCRIANVVLRAGSSGRICRLEVKSVIMPYLLLHLRSLDPQHARVSFATTDRNKSLLSDNSIPHHLRSGKIFGRIFCSYFSTGHKCD
jgi:hypothetical protein